MNLHELMRQDHRQLESLLDLLMATPVEQSAQRERLLLQFKESLGKHRESHGRLLERGATGGVDERIQRNFSHRHRRLENLLEDCPVSLSDHAWKQRLWEAKATLNELYTSELDRWLPPRVSEEAGGSRTGFPRASVRSAGAYPSADGERARG